MIARGTPGGSAATVLLLFIFGNFFFGIFLECLCSCDRRPFSHPTQGQTAGTGTLDAWLARISWLGFASKAQIVTRATRNMSSPWACRKTTG